MKKHLPALVFLITLTIQAFSQNVGVGTNNPLTKLDINGALSARITAIPAAATVTIPDNVTLFRLTNTTGGSTTALSLNDPKDGQFLTVINEDDNTATLNGFTIPAGTISNPVVANFINIGGSTSGWRKGGADLTLSTIGSTPNANGATLTGSTLNLQPANASFGGVVTTGAQTFAGVKTFTSTIAGSINGNAATATTATTAGSVTNPLTLNNAGTGAGSGATYNGGAPVTVSYNTIGAPSTTGAGASGTWGIGITGNAATATTATSATTATTAGSVSNSATFNNSGAGAGSGSAYNGGSAVTVSYNTIGAPSTTGAGASGTWPIGITGNAATATTTTNFSGSLAGDVTGPQGATLVGDDSHDHTYVKSKGQYVWSAATAPRNFPQAISASFVQAADGWPSYGSVVHVGTYPNDGGSLQLYAPYAYAYGGNSLRYRLGQYDNAGWTGWKTIWDDTNDGAGSGMDADLLDGQNGSYYAPASGSSGYIQNTTSQQASSNFNISGAGVVGTNLTVGGNVGIGTPSPQRRLDVSIGGQITFGDDVVNTSAQAGIYWHSGSDYGLYRTSGAWNSPNYQQLQMTFSTGIIIDGGSAYGRSGTVIQPGAGNVGIGTGTAQATEKLEVVGNIKYGSIRMSDGGTPVNQQVTTTKRYHVSKRYGTNVQSSIDLDMTIINELCGDEDGCLVRMIMKKWNSAVETAGASRGPWVFFYDQATNRYRMGENDVSGVDGDSGETHIANWWGCYFSDFRHSAGTAQNDGQIGFTLLTWTDSGTFADKTCELVFED